MATLSIGARDRAASVADAPLGPVAADAGHVDLGATQRFAIGEAGDQFVATATGMFHLLCGDGSVEATTNSPVFDRSVRLTLPDGCTHIAMLEAEADVSGCAYRG